MAIKEAISNWPSAISRRKPTAFTTEDTEEHGGGSGGTGILGSLTSVFLCGKGFARGLAMPPVPPLFLPCYAPVTPLLRIDSVREKGLRKARGIEVLHLWSIKALAFSPVFSPVSRGAAERWSGGKPTAFTTEDTEEHRGGSGRAGILGWGQPSPSGLRCGRTRVGHHAAILRDRYLSASPLSVGFARSNPLDCLSAADRLHVD
jgi:hypothetical protein